MRPSLKNIRYNGEHRLAFAYDDGLAAELNFRQHILRRTGPMSEPLRDERFFAHAFIDHGVLTWPNGFDVCPDVLRAWCEAGQILSSEQTNALFSQLSDAPAKIG